MIARHPNEKEIQDYIFENKYNSKIKEHIQHCEECTLKVINYQAIFAEVNKQEIPAFTFNLKKLVMEKLPNPKTQYSFEKYFNFIITGIIVLIFASLIYFLKNNFLNTLPILTYLIATIAIFVTAFLCIDMYKKYNAKINAINFY